MGETLSVYLYQISSKSDTVRVTLNVGVYSERTPGMSSYTHFNYSSSTNLNFKLYNYSSTYLNYPKYEINT